VSFPIPSPGGRGEWLCNNVFTNRTWAVMGGPVQLLMIETGCYLFYILLMAVIWGSAGRGSCHIDYICNRTTNLPLFSSLWTELGWPVTYYPEQGSHQFYYWPPKTYYLELKYLLVTDPTSHPKLLLNQFSDHLASLRKCKDIMADRSAGVLEDSVFKKLVIYGCLTFLYTSLLLLLKLNWFLRN